MGKPVPVWSGVFDSDGVPHLDAISMFKTFGRTMRNRRFRMTVRAESRPKSQQQLGYLFGIVYPVIADEMGYRDYEIEQVHDAIIRHLRGLKPDPNPLQLRVSLRDMSHEEVSAYIDDTRHWALTQHGIVTPDADKAEAA